MHSTLRYIECVQTPTPPSNDLAQGYWSSPAYLYYYDSSNALHNMLYYSATMDAGEYNCPNGQPCGNGFGPSGVSPQPLNAYQLQSTGSAGPIPSATPYANSGNQSGNQNSNYPILFCDHSPTPSVSSNGYGPTSVGTGIVWAIEQNQNTDNNIGHKGQTQDCAGSQFSGDPGALHAFCAASTGPATPCPSAMTELYSSRNVQTSIGPPPGFPTPTIFKAQVYMGTSKEVDVFGLCNTVQNGCKQ